MGMEEDRGEKPESAAEKTANIQLVHCGTCGHIAEPGSHFCSSCGASLADVTEALDATAAPNPGPVPGEGVLAGLSHQDAVLVVRKGPDAGAKFTLSGTNVTVGRSPEATIFLDDVTVSRRHADIDSDAGDWRLTDSGSLNGTYVNRNRIDSVLLENGDEVQIGKYRFVFHQVTDK